MKSHEDIFSENTLPKHRKSVEQIADALTAWQFGVNHGIEVTLNDAQAEIERLNKRITELQIDLLDWRNQADSKAAANRKAQAKLAKIRKVINEN